MAKQFSLQTLQSSLRAVNATWVAGTTHISQLTEAEQQRRLGLHINSADLARIRALRLTYSPRTVAFSPARDWRDKDGQNWLTSIKDQGNCGSCVAFSTVATIEAQARIFYNNSAWAIDLSEADLFFCGAGKNCGSGWWPPEAMQYAQTKGIADESCFPYQDHDMDCQLCSDRASRIVTIGSFAEVVDVSERKAFLDTKGPMVACLAIYRDFFSYKGGVYHHVTGDLAGYHAVCCVGYDDVAGCWICKNSWRDDFGENGYFRIAYGECEIDTTFAMYGPAGIGGTLKPQDDNNTEQGDDWAESILAEHSFADDKTVVWALVQGKLRSVVVTYPELGSLEGILFSAPSVRVFFKGENIEKLLAVRKLT